MAFNWQDPQYGITLTDGGQAIDPNGVSIGAPTTLASVVKNPDGSITYTWASGDTMTTKPGGNGSLTSGGLTQNFGPDGNTSTTKADGSAASASDIAAANARGGFGGITSWTDAAKTGIRSVKDAADSLNVVGTPGLNNSVANDKIFGGPNSGKNLFTDSSFGKILGGAATAYGLGGLKGDGTQPGGASGSGSGGGTGTGGTGVTGGGFPTAATDLTALQKQLADSVAANAGDRAPPTITAGGYTAPTIAAPTPVGYSGYTAPTINAPPTISAGQIGPVQQVTPTTITAGSVSAPVIGAPGTIQAGSITAPQIGVSDITKPGDVTAQKIDRITMDSTNADQSRTAMQNALAMAEGAANGTAPSAAVQLMQKAIDTNARQQLAAAGSLQGRSPGAALRAGQQGLMAANAASAADVAALRAQEQATGRQQYGTFASSLYQNDITRAAAQLGADVDVAKTNAINLLDAAKSNQSTALQTSIANMNKQVQVATANMQAALDAGKTNLAAAMQAQIENIRNTITVSTANASNELTSRIATLNAQMDAAKANQATALAAGQSNAANALNARIAQIQADLDASKANLSAVTQTNIANASLQANASQFNANAANTASLADLSARTTVGINNANLAASAAQFSADAANKAAMSNQSAALQQQIIDNARSQGLRDDQIQVLLAQMGFNYEDAKLALTKSLADQAATATGISNLGKLLSQLGSSGNGNNGNSYPNASGAIYTGPGQGGVSTYYPAAGNSVGANDSPIID